jgi:hypothetical protein
MPITKNRLSNGQDFITMYDTKNRLKLLSDYVSLANNLGDYYFEKTKDASSESQHNRYTFIAYSLLSVARMSDLVIRGTSEMNELLIFSGLRMLEENMANIAYVFHDEKKANSYISSILARGVEYQQAYTEVRYNPNLGMKHLNAVGKWSGATITQRIKKLGEGPEFRYELACKYLHADIWTILNDQTIKDKEGIVYGLMSWAIEDINSTISIAHSNEPFESKREKIHAELAVRLEEDFKHEPTQTYRI